MIYITIMFKYRDVMGQTVSVLGEGSSQNRLVVIKGLTKRLYYYHRLLPYENTRCLTAVPNIR